MLEPGQRSHHRALSGVQQRLALPAGRFDALGMAQQLAILAQRRLLAGLRRCGGQLALLELEQVRR